MLCNCDKDVLALKCFVELLYSQFEQVKLRGFNVITGIPKAAPPSVHIYTSAAARTSNITIAQQYVSSCSETYRKLAAVQYYVT